MIDCGDNSELVSKVNPFFRLARLRYFIALVAPKSRILVADHNHEIPFARNGPSPKQIHTLPHLTYHTYHLPGITLHIEVLLRQQHSVLKQGFHTSHYLENNVAMASDTAPEVGDTGK